MCELHPLRCTTCKHVWTAHKKLASCESQDDNALCPKSLRLYVGNPRKPTKSECDRCREFREMMESLEEDNEG
ncbi:uncharacterized protein BCR38DRAFT_387384 [Pseudomassariella vexata]|uniref:Uncharacterized protein n=1 Tax=Pseudomassariella vexata TaxID=1141098 RepID=A0A1Y2E677_9PEZI|nr:uncharacterized protein BCR38DRAFT_387384 [Pseudomassariella vexata]ORY67070.1 hypothetical protein BCR38DRAFT_387384 [Pseudomassariella vexata]